MKTFEIGKTYTARSACNHDCIFAIKVIKRTSQTLTFEQDGKARRAKIHTDNNGEWIMPERYSMSPIYRA